MRRCPTSGVGLVESRPFMVLVQRAVIVGLPRLSPLRELTLQAYQRDAALVDVAEPSAYTHDGPSGQMTSLTRRVGKDSGNAKPRDRRRDGEAQAGQ
jgi:hypothetical protein